MQGLLLQSIPPSCSWMFLCIVYKYITSRAPKYCVSAASCSWMPIQMFELFLLCESCWSGNCRATCKTVTVDIVRVDILMGYFSSCVVLPKKICILNCPLKLDANPKSLTFGLLCQSSWSGNCRAACKTATLDNVRVDILMIYLFKVVFC